MRCHLCHKGGFGILKYRYTLFGEPCCDDCIIKDRQKWTDEEWREYRWMIGVAMEELGKIILKDG